MAIYDAPESLHVGNGVETVFGFNWPYLLPRDLLVTVNGLPVPTVLASPNQVAIVPAPAALAIVRVYRNTPAQNPTYLFATGIPMLPKYIDGNNKQLLYALQEGLLQFSTTQATADEALAAAKAAQIAADAAAASAAQQARDMRRTLRVPTTDAEIPALASASVRANKVLGFDAQGNPVATLPQTGSGTELALDLLDSELGTGIVAHKSRLPGATARTAREAIDELFVNVCGFGATVIDNNNTPAVLRAWLAAPPGSTLLIPAGLFRLGETLRLPTKNVNIRCDGTLLVGAGTWDGVVFEGAPELTLPGTALTGITKGGMKLNFAGAAPLSNAHQYFFDVETTEVYVNRVTQPDYVPYTKSEPHSIATYDWRLSEPFLHTHEELAKATLHFTRKAAPTIHERLRIVAEADTDVTYRNLLRVRSQSNMTFEDLDLDSRAANRFGVGLGTSKCHNIRYIRPRISGFNISGVQGDISYPHAGHLSSYVYFDGVRHEQTSEDTGRPANPKRSRGTIDHYCNYVFFDNSDLTGGIDAHIGYNYYLRDSRVVQDGLSFVGINATLERVRAAGGDTGARSLFSVRGDAPYCQGKLTIKDSEIPHEWLAVYLTTSTAADPLGRTSKFKMFDEIEIENLTVTGTGAQAYNTVFNFSGVRNFDVFPTPEKTARISIRGVRGSSKMKTGADSFMRVGDADVTVLGQPSLVVGDFSIDGLELPTAGRLAAPYTGDIVFGPCSIDTFSMERSTGISMYRIRGMSKLRMRRVATNTRAEMYFEKFNDIDVTLDTCELNVPLNGSAIGAVGAPSFTLLNNVFNAIQQIQNGKIVRGNGNVVAAALTVPGFYNGKLSNYTDATVFKTSDYSQVVGAAPPVSAPVRVGQTYLDTTNKKEYRSFGTTSAADWVLLN